MKKYTVEYEHEFLNLIYERLNSIRIDCLTMDEDRNFTSIVEAYELDQSETLNNALDFVIKDYKRIFQLKRISELIRVPIFYIFYFNNKFHIYKLEESIIYDRGLSEKEFIDFWKKIKKTKQTHPLINGAQERASESIFYNTLSKYGLSWGGNIDGIIFESNKITGIIDDISIGFTQLDNISADPSLFFFKRGPRYETWLSTVKLAKTLKVPHLLITKNKKDQKDNRIGLTSIEVLTKKGIFYLDDLRPSNNIIIGLDKIVREVKLQILKSPVPDYK